MGCVGEFRAVPGAIDLVVEYLGNRFLPPVLKKKLVDQLPERHFVRIGNQFLSFHW
jgi:hypothetical protein